MGSGSVINMLMLLTSFFSHDILRTTNDLQNPVVLADACKYHFSNEYFTAATGYVSQMLSLLLG